MLIFFHTSISLILLHTILKGSSIKTRRGSPVDDSPSTDKLHHFVRKLKKKKKKKKKKNKKKKKKKLNKKKKVTRDM